MNVKHLPSWTSTCKLITPPSIMTQKWNKGQQWTPNHSCLCFRRCGGCQRKPSLRTNSFFEQFPKVLLSKLLMMIYLWSTDLNRRQTANNMKSNNNLVCWVFRRLQEVCSIEIEKNCILPFGGRCLIKCDESKFNYKAKGNTIIILVLNLVDLKQWGLLP